jgi:uncharacterized protein YjbJ (UPF0337 family)
MNKQTVEGKFDQVAGKIKEKVGEATGNQRLANAGAADQIKGMAKETWGKTKDAAQEASDTHRVGTDAEGKDLKARTENDAHDIRGKITTAARDLKEKVDEKLDDFKHNQRKEQDTLRH